MLFRWLFIFILLFSQILSAQNRINRFKHQERQGKWIVYQDSTKLKIDNSGRYRKGVPKGTWTYYDVDGKVVKKEKYRFKKIYTTFYHPNGKIKKQGKAKIVQEEKTIHFFYYGNWNVYDSLGNLTKTQVYEKGTKISEKDFKCANETGINDSLVTALKKINIDIYKYFDSVRIAEKTFGKSSQEYQRAMSLNTLNTSKYLSELDLIISIYGYPGKTFVGKENTIAFSIISSANIEYKEKYYKIIISAADKGELDWIDVAFFVDKVKVAKKEKQIYGTQFIFQDKYAQLFYPIENISTLNERRKKVGLDDVNIAELKFTTYQ